MLKKPPSGGFSFVGGGALQIAPAGKRSDFKNAS